MFIFATNDFLTDCEFLISSALAFLNDVPNDFIETEMYWPINHMVAPKEESLSCESCHSRENSRLANLTDFYMPGRDYNSYVEFFGKLIIILTLLGVLTHGAIRVFIAKKNNKAGN